MKRAGLWIAIGLSFLGNVCQSAQAQSLIQNGSFENGLANWQASGNVQAYGGEGATNGSYSAVWNGGDSAPNGVLSQSFATTAGQTYNLQFDYGAFSGGGTTPQSLKLQITGNSTLLSQTVTTATPIADQTAHFAHYDFTFVADSAVTTLRFIDQSTFTYSEDGVLDFVQVSAASDGSRIINTIAGTGQSGYSGDGGPATSARLSSPSNVALDSNGNLYIADCVNHRIRKVNISGVITTIAGTGRAGYNGDGGAATSATLSQPFSVALDSNGNLYIADTGNDLHPQGEQQWCYYNRSGRRQKQQKGLFWRWRPGDRCQFEYSLRRGSGQ